MATSGKEAGRDGGPRARTLRPPLAERHAARLDFPRPGPRRGGPRSTTGNPMTSLPPLFAVLAAVLLAASPTPSAPVPTCDYCGMWIEHPEFIARMQTIDRQYLRF